MENNGVKLVVLFLLLLFLQIWIFNRIHILGFATPLLYIYLVIKLPINMNRNIVLLIASIMGLLIDVFSFTLGLHMLACVIAGFLRYYVLKIFTPREIVESLLPSFSSFGKGLFLRYAASIVLVHHVTLFFVEFLSLFDPLNLLLCIVGSFILTMFLVFTFESINIGVVKK